MLRDLNYAASSIGSQINLRPTFTLTKNLAHCLLMLFCLRPQRKRIRLVYRVYLVLDMTEAVQNLLVGLFRLVLARFFHSRWPQPLCLQQFSQDFNL